MSMKKQAMLSVMALAMIGGTVPIHSPNEPIEIQPKPPTGTKEYFFNASGDYSTEKMLKSETVFICYAINDKNAVRKFNNRNV